MLARVSDPGTEPGAFRDALSEFPTAVTVVTASVADGPSGATANAVCSLSLDPPLMLACLDRGSRTLRVVQAAGHFGISVLAAGQEGLALGFSSKAPVPEKWDGVAWSDRAGIPALDGSLLWIGCELVDVIAGGDHVIVTGSVLDLEPGEGEPLLFHRGTYRTLG
jgi:3-hydroxy-9,10-secoandrosta-1,3,5(10)-triene-9,17-dione monooxygenase reductase component